MCSSEAESSTEEFFETTRIRQIIQAYAAASCADIQLVIQRAVETFTEGMPQRDDMTLVILEYNPYRGAGLHPARRFPTAAPFNRPA